MTWSDHEIETTVKNKIDVLDKGYVRLVKHMGSDLGIIRNARVSYDGDTKTGSDMEADKKLLNYLYKNRHTSPFEAAVFTFEVKAPIFNFRQWHRHRTWAYNEISARYAVLDEGFYVPDPKTIGIQHSSNKQMRTFDLESDDLEAQQDAARIMKTCHEHDFKMYNIMIEKGVPRELARTVLPVAAYSRMYATVNLHNLFHFLRLRLHEHSQYEIRVYAEAIVELIRPIVPWAVEAFEKEQEFQRNLSAIRPKLEKCFTEYGVDAVIEALDDVFCMDK